MGKNAKIENFHFITLIGPYIVEVYENHQKTFFLFIWVLGGPKNVEKRCRPGVGRQHFRAIFTIFRPPVGLKQICCDYFMYGNLQKE